MEKPKTFKEMNHSQFTAYNLKHKDDPLSDFAQFLSELRGYDLSLNGYPVDKWEIFNSKITAKRILADQTKYRFKKRVGKIILPVNN